MAFISQFQPIPSPFFSDTHSSLKINVRGWDYHAWIQLKGKCLEFLFSFYLFFFKLIECELFKGESNTFFFLYVSIKNVIRISKLLTIKSGNTTLWTCLDALYYWAVLLLLRLQVDAVACRKEYEKHQYFPHAFYTKISISIF